MLFLCMWKHFMASDCRKKHATQNGSGTDCLAPLLRTHCQCQVASMAGAGIVSSFTHVGKSLVMAYPTKLQNDFH